MSGLPLSPTPAAPGDTTTAFGMLGRQLQWRPLLLVGLVIVGLLAITSISLETGDTWDRQFDRPLYFAVLLGSLVMAVRLWQPGQTLARASWQLLQAVTGWPLLKFALLLLFAAPGILARELVESLLWLPTLLNWGLISSFNLGRVALGRRITLSFLALSALLSGAWLLRWGWEPQVIQVLLQLLLSSATGYVYMSYFIQRVQQSRFSEGEHEALARLAYTDLLTGLPNRLRLQEELERRTAAEEAFAVLVIDLDSFKVVNDTLGHNAGDTLLCAVTEVLRASPDTQAAFRLNGDEFVVLLSGVSGPEAIAGAQAVQARALRHPLMQREVASTLSIGVSLYPEDASSASEVLRHADSPMSAVKRSGRGQVRRYQSEYDAQTERFQLLARELAQAFYDGQGFSLAYQPIYDLASGVPVKVEALLRWRHPQLGQISPAEFIPIAERTGQIAQIGLWVLDEACRAAQAWPQLRLSVNVSAVQLSRPEFAAQLFGVLDSTGMTTQRLELELTETALLHENEQVQLNIEQLYQRGIGLTIDDFGAGYSNLSRLRAPWVRGVKLDRSLTSDLPEPSGEFSRQLTRNAANLAQYQHTVITAEGLESAAHVEAARQLGCPLGQGYALSYPLTAEQLSGLLAAQEQFARA